MGQIYLYFVLFPNALIASALKPDDFGHYMTGNKDRHATGQQKIFFELDFEVVKNDGKFNFVGIEEVFEKEPGKKSEYIATFNVLSNLNIFSFLSMYLATKNGQVLELKEGQFLDKQEDNELYLYQQLAPDVSLIASRLRFISHLESFTNKKIKRFGFPKMILTELVLNGLGKDPLNADIKSLPYSAPDNLRACLQDLKNSPADVKTKGIDGKVGDIHWRTINNGFIVGSGDGYIYYPFPSIIQLEVEFYSWWRHAKSE